MLNLASAPVDRVDPWSRLFVVALAAYPYVFLLNLFLSFQVAGGKNLYVALETAVMVVVAAALWRRIGSLAATVVATVLVAALTVVLLRALVFGEPLAMLGSSRLPFTFLLYACVCCAVMTRPALRPVVHRVIVANSLIQALIGIVHDTWFSNFMTGPNVALMGGGDRLWFIAAPGMRFRETGALISASLYANFIVLGMFVVVFAPRSVERRLNWRWAVEACALAVMMYGLSLSGSRFPIVTAMVLFVVHLLRHLSLRALVPAAAGVAAGLFLMMPFAMNVINRFQVEGTGGRLIKAELGWQLLNETPTRLLLGAPFAAQDAAISGNLGLSDNSLYALVLLLGPPVAFLFIGGVIAMLMLTTRLKWHGPLILYFTGVLLLTNGIYWDIWILYSFATLYSMQPWREPLRPLHYGH